MSAPLLDVRGLTLGYGGAAPVVDGLDLAVHAGERVALTGRSGVGKTSVALAVLGLDAMRGLRVRGSIRWDGRQADAAALARLRGRSIGWVPQEPVSALNPYRRCGAQVAEALSGSRRARRGRVAQLLEQVGLDAGVAGAYPHRISGGMCQRVLVAAALGTEPRLLVADEPTASLDALSRLEVVDLLGRVVGDAGCALLLVTHDRRAVDALCDREVVLLPSGATP